MGDRNAAAGQPASLPFARLSGRSAAARRASVAADMQAIFGAGDGKPARLRLPLALSDDRRVLRARPRARRIVVPLLLLTCLAGAAAGLVVVAPLHDQNVTPGKAMIVRQRGALPSDSTMPIAMTAVTRAASDVTFKAPARLRSARDTPIEGQPADARLVQADAFEPQPLQPERVAIAPPPQEEGRIGCDDAETAGYDACSRADVVAADHDLRLAYRRAVEAGVDRSRLVSIRNRWARLRVTESDRPGELLADYAELSDRLDRAAANAGDDLR